MSLNRNKESITLNLKVPEAKEIVRQLVQKVDVLVENFRPGTMEKLGLGYEELKKLNPRLIYAASTGFGQTGPYSQRPAYDGVMQAMGGIMSITGQPGSGPTRVGPSIGDLAAGLFCAIGVVTALYERDRSGLGQMVDVAMLDCQVALLENAIARYDLSGEVPGPIGNRHPSIVPFEPFETKTTPIMLAAGNDKLWQSYCAAVGLEEGLGPEFASNPLRNQNYAQLRELVQAKMLTKSCEDWVRILNEAGIPNGPINSVDKVLEDEQVKAREMIVELEHPVAGKTRMPGVPIKLSRTPGSIRKPAPVLGADTAGLLNEFLGLSEEKINTLREKGAI